MKTLDEEFEFVYTDSEDYLRNNGIYYITGEIGEDSLLGYHQDILAKHLDKRWKNKDIQLIINSIGGEVPEGWMLIDLMDYVRMDIRTVGMGEICSLGTMLVAAGTPGKRSVSANCALMVHGFSMSNMKGTRQDLVDTMGFVEREHEREIQFWERNSKLSRDDVEKLFLDGRDHYFTPHEALELGIVDEVSEPKYSKAPEPKRRRK
jgi:ATP-dependent Clp protease protease subunit